MKKEHKIRKLLGRNYHLCIIDTTGEWKLFKKYPVWEMYLNENNKPIMTSEDSTEEDLYNFAKKHKKYDIGIVVSRIGTLTIEITLILKVLTKILFKMNLSSLFLGLVLGEFIIFVIFEVFNIHNLQVESLELEEDFERYLRHLKEEK